MMKVLLRGACIHQPMQYQKENIFSQLADISTQPNTPWLWFSVSQILPNGKSIGRVKMEEESWAKSYQQIESSVNCNCGLIYFRHQLMLVNLEIRPLHFQSHFQHCKELALWNGFIWEGEVAWLQVSWMALSFILLCWLLRELLSVPVYCCYSWALNGSVFFSISPVFGSLWLSLSSSLSGSLSLSLSGSLDHNDHVWSFSSGQFVRVGVVVW